MRLLFIVQGEGRGHLTQALVARSLLEAAGHAVTCVLTGSVRRRRLPPYFVEKIGAPVRRYASPGFYTGRDHRSIRRLGTLVENIARVPAFGAALGEIHRAIESARPDLVLTFYEPMAGVYHLLYRPRMPFVAVSHQYMFEHPDYSFAPGARIDRTAMALFTRLTALGAAWKLALSLYSAKDLPEARLSVLPPLLRRDLLVINAIERAREDFFLLYLLNRGYADQVVAWHEAHPHVRLECFWDHPEAEKVIHHDDTLSFHRLDDTKFLDLMGRCSGMACTAGFEAVCEALYLGKPILAVPVAGHYEQQCNAREVEMLGAGLRSDRFDLNPLIDFTPQYDAPVESFRDWVDQAPGRVVGVLETVAAGGLPAVEAAVGRG